MPSLKYYFKKARKEGFAIGQFNVSNLETLRAVILAAQNLKSPVIIGTSERESQFLGMRQAVSLVKTFRKETGLPIFLNLDHGRSFRYIKKAIDLGYDTCHFDGSKLKLRENIKITKKAVKYARKRDILIEGEVGFVSGSSTLFTKIPKLNKEDFTDPLKAKNFIRQTQVDRLAVNVGTLHGMSSSGRNPRVNLKLLKAIKKAVGNFLLVLHGGSVVSEKDIREAIKLGVVKVNVNTELRVAYSNTLRKVLRGNPKEMVPYKYMPKVIKAIEKVVERKIKLFKSNNKI
ncbi:MAG TPA: class II fructose-bisphosphate aldolase [Candidatus Parcubacteria bacterium]|nr:class II fructose-bisphosphate aldolase [Candidatus Parcubacteria bacterium]